MDASTHLTATAGSAVSNDFHTGILTVGAGLIIALAAKRLVGNTFRNNFERYADVFTLIVALLPVSYALAGLATQNTSRDIASAMVFVTLVAIILLAATSLYRTLTTNSLLDDDDERETTAPQTSVPASTTPSHPTHWLTITINFGPRRPSALVPAATTPQETKSDKRARKRLERRKLAGSVVTFVFLIGLLVFATQDAFREVYTWSQSP